MGAVITFKPIQSPHMYGEFAIHGRRMVEVVRTDNCSGHWAVFCFVGNCMVPAGELPQTDGNMSYTRAKQVAVSFLLDTTRVATREHEFEGLAREQRVGRPALVHTAP